MTAIIDNIRSRGHWDVAIRPAAFDPSRIARTALVDVITNSTVRLRGWPLPYVDQGDAMGQWTDHIGQEVDASTFGHLEAWRFFTSGQFTQLRTVSADLRTGAEAAHVPPGATSAIDVWDVLFYLTEVAELAARLAVATHAADEDVIIEVTLHRAAGRALVSEPRRELHHTYVSRSDSVATSRQLPAAQLAADSRGVGVELARGILAGFGFDASPAVLRDYQDELPGLR